MSNPNIQPTMPDSIITAMVRGTSKFPQIDIAAIVEVGAASCAAVERGDATWQAVASAQVTEDQVSRLAVPSTHAMHKQYNIDIRFASGNPYENQGPIPLGQSAEKFLLYLPLTSLQRHIMNRRGRALNASRMALETLVNTRDDAPLWRRLSGRTAPTLNIKPRFRTIVGTAEALDSEEFEVEASILSSFWKISAAALKTPETHGKAKEYRQTVDHLYSTASPWWQNRNRYGQSQTITKVIRDALLHSRQELESQHGRSIPRSVVRAFIRGTESNRLVLETEHALRTQASGSASEA